MKISVVYATQMGTTQMITGLIEQELGGEHEVEVVLAASANADTLRNSEFVIFAIPTYDEGNIEATARPYFEGLANESGITTRYAMIAPGDSTYPEFCHAYDRVKEAVEKIGMTEAKPVLKLDQYISNTEECDNQIRTWLGELKGVLNQ